MLYILSYFSPFKTCILLCMYTGQFNNVSQDIELIGMGLNSNPGLFVCRAFPFYCFATPPLWSEDKT